MIASTVLFIVTDYYTYDTGRVSDMSRGRFVSADWMNPERTR